MATPTSLPATFVAGNVLTAAQMNDLRGAFRILQVVSTTKTDTFTTTSTSFTDVTGMSVTITPTATSSKVLVLVSMIAGTTSSNTSPLAATATQPSFDLTQRMQGTRRLFIWTVLQQPRP